MNSSEDSLCEHKVQYRICGMCPFLMKDTHLQTSSGKTDLTFHNCNSWCQGPSLAIFPTVTVLSPLRLEGIFSDVSHCA